MEEDFGMAVPNARVMVDDVGVTEALEYKERLEAAAGVDDVMWLDDVADLSIPLEMLDADTVSAYYKDGHALFDVTIASGAESEAMDAIYGIIGAVSYTHLSGTLRRSHRVRSHRRSSSVVPGLHHVG